MENTSRINVTQVIDDARISAFQWRVYALLFLVVLLDGYDTQSIAFVAPSISKAWNLDPASFGPIFSAGLSGIAVGAVGFGKLADRLGRRTLVTASVTMFGLFTFVCGLTSSYNELLVCRLLAGIGLGGAVVNFFTLVAEYSPSRLLVTIVAVCNWGFPLGAVVGGSFAGKMIERFGWQSIFYLGAILPLLAVPILIGFLPESVRYMTLDPRKRLKIAQILSRIDSQRSFSATDEYYVAEAPAEQGKIGALFRNGLGAGTILLSFTLFFSLVLVFCLVNWLPLLLRQAGLPINVAVFGTVMLNFSGIVGSLVVSRLISVTRHASRYPFRTLAAFYLLGALFVASIWAAGHNVILIMSAIFLTGFFIIGAQIAVGAYVSGYYPTAIRGTGVGWCQGFSRIGALLGPLAGGAVLALAVQPFELFLFCSIPALAASFALLVMARVTRMRQEYGVISSDAFDSPDNPTKSSKIAPLMASE